ncbi:MAG: Rossmann-like and DUF2520 domain-containing protein [Desulfosalsimonadaceae bacterium]
MATKESFAIIGCGRAGTAFARALSDAGYTPSGFASRSLSSARRVSDIAGYQGANVSTFPWEVTGEADFVLVTTPDDVIRHTAEDMAVHAGMKKGAAAFHCSGALSSTELASLADAGFQTGSIHPLQSFGAAPYGKNPFEGIMMGIEGDREAVERARIMAEALGATPFQIDTAGKMIYHAAAVVASNYLVTLMKSAMALLGASGVDPEKGFAILKPLIMGTLGNIENSGPVDALTGPIVRGDTAIVRAHVATIRRDTPQMLALYQLLGKHTVEIASERGSISDEKRRELLSALSG